MAFSDCRSLTSVVIPESVTEIGRYAFYGCRSLTSVSISDGVKIIDRYAFYGCTLLTSVVLPASVVEIGDSAFECCTSLASIVIPENLAEIGSAAFGGCTSLTSIDISESVAEIGDAAFEGCTSLATVSILGDIGEISKSTFQCCSSLASINIPEGVMKIGSAAFEGCTSLGSVSIPESVKEIGRDVFKRCKWKSLGFKYDGTRAQWEAIKKDGPVTDIDEKGYRFPVFCKDGREDDEGDVINGGVFEKFYPRKKDSKRNYSKCNQPFEIPAGVTAIGKFAFDTDDSDKLESVSIPASVTTIGKGAFRGCEKLREISYGGTIAQWKAVQKDFLWYSDVKTKTVRCTDGEYPIDTPTVGDLIGDSHSSGRYKILSQLPADSGEAEIYVCKKGGTEYILKYYISHTPDSEALEKLKALDNPHILKVYESGEYNGRPFTVTEYARGGTLAQKDGNGGYTYLPLTEEEAKKVAADVIDGLRAIHGAGLIHRDIKPENLFYKSEDGSGLVIGDFGICTTPKNASKQTEGTFGFFAPETYSNHPEVAGSLDYFALGITLWMLLAGQEPFVTEDVKTDIPKVMFNTLAGTVPNLLFAKSPGLSPSMQKLIRGLLTVKADQRWKYDEVNRFLQGKAVNVVQDSPRFDAFRVGNRQCRSFEEIAHALIEDPEGARQVVADGTLTACFVKVDQNFKRMIDNLIEENGTVDNDAEKGLFMAYMLDPNARCKLSDSVSIDSWKGFAAAFASEPDLVLEYLTGKRNGLYAYLSARFPKAEVQKIKGIVQGSAPDLVRTRLRILLNGNAIVPFSKDSVNEDTKLEDTKLEKLENLFKLPDYLQRRVLILLNAGEPELCAWVENVRGDESLESVKKRLSNGGK
ncbi:MAG: leucine-rich repeat protein [Treponema sp.]|nr:leucine-rich repeat protein [Treponema sp.]